MSNLIPIPISDQQALNANSGLVASTFYNQLITSAYPAIYIELGTIGPLSFVDGILTIGNNIYNMFSRHIIDVVQTINTAGGQAWLTSANLALYPALFLDNIQSTQILNIELQKSPTLLSDYIPSIINNIITIDDNLIFAVQTVFDTNGNIINYTYNSTTHNLYVDSLGTAILQFSANNFLMFARTDRLLSTTSLIQNTNTQTLLLLDNTDSSQNLLLIDTFNNTEQTYLETDNNGVDSSALTDFEKSLVLDTLVDTSNIFYE